MKCHTTVRLEIATVEQSKSKFCVDSGNSAATAGTAATTGTAPEPEQEMWQAPSLTVVAYTTSLKSNHVSSDAFANLLLSSAKDHAATP